MNAARERLLEDAGIFLDCYAESVSVPVDSPIEVEMLAALNLVKLIIFREGPRGVIPEKSKFHISPQHTIGKFRVDFLITSSLSKHKIVVECDGHDFHERTKEQAEKDKSRDRDLLLDGYQVMRFTGSEIWRDPWDCASQIVKFLIRSRSREDELKANG